MPLLDSDLAQQEVQGEKTGPSRLKLALGLAMAVLGLGIGLIFLLAPKQAQKTVSQVVQAAQSLVKKSPAAAVPEEDESEPVLMAKRTPRRFAGSGTPPRAHISAPQPSAAPGSGTQAPGVRARRSLESANLRLGTARGEIREMFGDPDLELYKLEKEHEVEHYVYVDRARNYATSILLVDGRVAMVFGGMPSVWSWP